MFVKPGDMVICRLNAPLVRVCYRLLRQGIKAVIRGRDIGVGLLAMITRSKAKNIIDLLTYCEEYIAKESEKNANRRNAAVVIAGIQDRVDTLIAMCDGQDTIEDVKSRIEKIFSDYDDRGKENPPVLLSSIHKAKGLESDRVFWLGPELCPFSYATTPEQIKQEQNLIYVAITRAKQTLIRVPLPKDKSKSNEP